MMKNEVKNLRDFDLWLESNKLVKAETFGIAGLTGSSKAFILSYLRKKIKGPFLIIVPHLRTAQILIEDILFFEKDLQKNLILFPQWENLPYDEISPHPEIVRQRVKCLYSLLRGNDGIIIISPIKAIIQKVISPKELEESILYLRRGEEIDRNRLLNFLLEKGYQSVKIVEERGDFSIRGSIVDIYTPFYDYPLRLEFNGDLLESIRRFDPESQRSIPNSFIEEAIILTAKDISNDLSSNNLSNIFDFLNGNGVVFIDEEKWVKKEINDYSQMIQERYKKASMKKTSAFPPEILYLTEDKVLAYLKRFPIFHLTEDPIVPRECGRAFLFKFERNDDIRNELKASISMKSGFNEQGSIFSLLLKRLKEWQKKDIRCYIVSHNINQAERLRDLLSSYNETSYLETSLSFKEALEKCPYTLNLLVGSLSSGFRYLEERWVLLTEEEIFGERRRISSERKISFSSLRGSQLLSSRELKDGDLVVHVDYGVGRYMGLKNLKIGGVSNDYLLVEYLGGDKLYVPVDRINLIQRYIGGDGSVPKLDKLGTTSWQRVKKRVNSAISEMVKEIIDLYAVRQAFEGYSFPPLDHFYKEFEATFEYEETPDQLKAIEDVMRDMGLPKPMDRLICGDVGFGKTEVAIRAAYRAVMAGKQVALLVPTTLLAQQHYQTFKERFKIYPVVIEVLNRFRTSSEQKDILKRLQEGKVDILIGTHRILQKDVVFRDLGLVIIDEEHRFGVSHKERLKQLRKLVDVITLTATPIPRTLQMALTGIRDLSLIQTPPENRLSIRTFIARYDDELIEEAIRREFERGGQVFFVQPRIQNIQSMANHLKHLIPEAHVAVAHGQMNGKELEEVMLKFINKKINLLVCTNIIGSGIDIPTANTILINHAEQFGLADLYQLRGRVGRGSEQAYAYLLVPGELSLSKDALKRLRAIQEFSELGSGFKLAMEDLEIRGAGNLLGKSQSGHISAVGFELYCQMMEKAIKELKGEPIIEEITPEIHIGVSAFIPEYYIEEPIERLNIYRRLSICKSDDEVERIREELIDRFGPIPEEVNNLLEVIKIKIILTQLAIKRVEANASQWVLSFHESTPVLPSRVLYLAKESREFRFRFTPDSKLIVEDFSKMGKDPIRFTKNILKALA